MLRALLRRWLMIELDLWLIDLILPYKSELEKAAEALHERRAVVEARRADA